MNYYFSKVTPLSFEQAIDRVTALLKEQGFGIITQIDVTDTFKQKLGVDPTQAGIKQEMLRGIFS